MSTENKGNLARHSRLCGICKHRLRSDIESDFIGWRSPSAIAAEYKLRDRSTVYRHAKAFDLFPQRRRNLRGALEKFVEQADTVRPTAAAIVSAVEALAKINAAGEWIERDRVSVRDLFDRLSREELELYAREGRLPAWFTSGGEA